MMARFELQLTYQQKGAFHSHLHEEIEYSSFLFIFLPLKEKLQIKLDSCFLGKK